LKYAVAPSGGEFRLPPIDRPPAWAPRFDIAKRPIAENSEPADDEFDRSIRLGNEGWPNGIEQLGSERRTGRRLRDRRRIGRSGKQDRKHDKRRQAGEHRAMAKRRHASPGDLFR
jgi:hypothetical protein